jgi:cysteine synthase A
MTEKNMEKLNYSVMSMMACIGEALNYVTYTAPARDALRADQILSMLADQVADYPATPVVDFGIKVTGKTRRIHLKLEGESPWRSIKGRTAISLMASIAPGVTESSHLVESTSGNLGVALAELARDLRLRFTAVTDDRLPDAMSRRMLKAGAELVLADRNLASGDRLLSRLKTVEQLCNADSASIWPNQYENPMNPLIHEIWTGPELLAQVPDVDAAFIAVSTGGTLAGVSRAVRAARRGIKIVGVDVEGSRALGGPDGSRILTGIGASRPSAFLDKSAYDAVETVSSWSGVQQCREWRRMTGLSLGGSSGVLLAAALRHLEQHPEITRVVCLCPDLGDNYVDTIYNDEWPLAKSEPPALLVTPPSLTRSTT